MSHNAVRVIYKNLADSATLSASSSASASTGVGNLKTNYKRQVWRSVGTSAVITATLNDLEYIGCVALPLCNLSVTSTIRVRVYDAAVLGALVYDSGTQPANPPGTFGELDWGYQALGFNNHYTLLPNHAYAVVWIPKETVGQRIEIELADPTDNQFGYLEAARLVIGTYWEPEITADLGVQLGLDDNSSHTRTESHDLRTTQRPANRVLSFALSSLDPDEGQVLQGILNATGISKPIFVSLYPEHEDPNMEKVHTVFGKLQRSNPMSTPFYNTRQQSLTVEEF